MVDDILVELSWLKFVSQLSKELGQFDNARLMDIGSAGKPLADRVLIKRDRESCIYHHTWRRSDPDDLHDHPWDSCSIMLTVGYWEVIERTHTYWDEFLCKCEDREEQRIWRAPGSVTFRKAIDRHKIEISEDGERPTSLFITGPEIRGWGFWVNGKFVKGSEYRAEPTLYRSE